MKKLLTLLFFIHVGSGLFAQDAYLKGQLSDLKTKETIVGASIVIDDTTGTTTDINGAYSFKTTKGKHKAEFKFVGYKPQIKTIDLKENDTTQINVTLEGESKQLDIVVVSAGKFEQNLNEVTVSMEVLKPSLIENKSIQTIEKAVDQVPGVNVIDGQANIRGGSGFSYGAGSRVLLMVDEMPMLTADAGDVKWTFLPVENCEQIEVIKGASSALFGSSAMNGVINFRTAYAKDEPETKINFYAGVYDKPKRKELVWWQDGNPGYSGINFFHAQKIKNLDLVIGGNLYSDQGYRYLETEQRYRANANLRYRFSKKKLQGLQVGVNVNTIRTQGGLFLIWENVDSGAYRPSGGDLSHYTTYRTNIDPFVTYNTKNNGRHTLRGRYFTTKNLNNTNQESTADVYYSEYQYQKHFDKGLTWTLGAVCNYNEVHSGPLYGTHFSTNVAAFTQFDKKWDRLNVSFGLRGEYFKTDSVETHEDVYLLMDKSKPIAKQSKVKPVFRAGANYRLFKGTFMRASFGQGFRFPTVAEKFIKTSASGLDIYPNENLKPESGWSAEIGIKQGVLLGHWKGYLDLAYFWSEYYNMMEFTFGQYGPVVGPNYGLGFQSQNIGNTRIKGVDASLMGQGMMGPINVSLLIGYTYIDPRQTDFNLAKDTVVNNSAKTNVLKYRYRHSGKADVELGYKKVYVGVSMRANSFMENVDGIFVSDYFFPGVKDYRAKHNKGDAVFDFRISYQMSKSAKMSFIVNNMFNREVMNRPMNILAPRVYAIQLTLKF
jgi:outer membrane receptor protein involved in Fe transport